MATLALSAAGAAIGGAVLPNIGVLGATLTGAAIGRAAGALAGRYIDQALFAPSGQERVVEGPRLDDLHLLASGEGAPIPRLWGRARLGGQIIWGPPFEEQVVTSSAGGSGGGKASQSSSGGGSRRDYRYFSSFAVGLCEGPIARIGRVWADGKELDLATLTYRLHAGAVDQDADPLIVAHEGAENTPAYRGLAYIVFERMALARFGNRLPQLSFEVFRPVDDFEQRIKAVTIIPAAGEFAYDTSEIVRTAGASERFTENTHTLQGGSDWSASMDALQASAPELKHASLIVSWFGTDLRADHCDVRPGVERREKETLPHTWSVQGLSRVAAHEVSQVDGRPAFGGTPADRSVIAALRDLAARGVKATFYPFLMMDVPEGNSLEDPYGGAAQSVYPWRGRITVSPAPGQPLSPDKTAQAAVDVARFVGDAAVSDFAVAGDSVTYSGPAEWSWRRMILHYAHLCKAAGGVDAFLIGSELRGLTWVRDETGGYPFVDALVALARDVREVVGPETTITYAADWSEYFGHQPSDGTGDVAFHLDPLWASADIDAVGIDCYWPLADWRDGEGHADRLAGYTSTYDLDYLSANVQGGEGYDWYYANLADREAQVRTPITDGAGKPWVFRFKDLASWWGEAHFNRPGGVENSTPTAWVPGSKPIWFTEIGCPAVDRGANQPNVFVDPKSTESSLPYFSAGRRDDLMQRRYITAMLSFFDPGDQNFVAARNPHSTLYDGRMIDLDRLYLYTWDARPYPAFPRARSVWSDGDNWTLGHWLTGRLGGLDLAQLIASVLGDYGFDAFDAACLEGTLHGLVVERLMSARQALQPLELAFFFDAFEDADIIRFCHRGGRGTALNVGIDDLVETTPGAMLHSVTRAEENELPASVKLGFIDEARGYERASQESQRLTTESSRVATADLPLVLDVEQARGIAEQWLHDAWQSRETATFHLPPSRLGIAPSDIVSLDGDATSAPFRVTGLTSGNSIEVEARTIVPEVFAPPPDVSSAPEEVVLPVIGPIEGHFLDLPRRPGESEDTFGWFAAAASPWPGMVDLYRSAGNDALTLVRQISRPATIGRVTEIVEGAAVSRWDRATAFDVTLTSGTLAALPRLTVLNGGNIATVHHGDNRWEVIQFQNAELIGADTYRLTSVLRGQLGTEQRVAQPPLADATFVLLDDAVVPLELTPEQRGLPFTYIWGPSQRPLAHFSYTQRDVALDGIAYQPISPVHVRRRATTAGDSFSWIRRTRYGGDSWVDVDVGLGEAFEQYRFEILQNGTPIRAVTVAEPNFLYETADQTSDWGASIPLRFDVRVAQVSATYGVGQALSVTL
ncbi:MAG: glycoside hydrolase/phage tail family protein [Pseudomonadota bacterium]